MTPIFRIGTAREVEADERKGMKRVSGLAEAAVPGGPITRDAQENGERGNERNPLFRFTPILVLAFDAVRSTRPCYSSRLAALWKILPSISLVVRASIEVYLLRECQTTRSKNSRVR